MTLRLNFPIPRAVTRRAPAGYNEAERACIEAERAYFAYFPRPQVVTVTREEGEAKRRFREAWERESTQPQEGEKR